MRTSNPPIPATRRLWRSVLVAVAVVVVISTTLAGLGIRDSHAQENQIHRFGVVGFYTPRLMFERFQPLMDYLSRHTGEQWELVINTDYQAAIDDLCSGAVSVAYMGPFSYVRAHEQCGVAPVLQLMTRGMTTFRSSILVRDDSPVHTIAELEGRSFGFGARLSTSSHLMPRSMLVDAGVNLENIACVYYSNYERALRAVLVGEVDACGVRDLIDDQVLHRGLRVLDTSTPIPNFVLAVTPGASGWLEPLLVEALIGLPASNPDAASQLKDLDDELNAGFEPSVDGFYQPIRDRALGVFGPGALTLPEDDLGCDGGW